MPNKLFEFRVRMRRPEGVTEEHLRDYIEEAVSGWKGQFIDDPILDLDVSSIRVMRGKIIKTTRR